MEVIGVTGLELIVIGTGGMPQVFDVPHQVAALVRHPDFPVIDTGRDGDGGGVAADHGRTVQRAVVPLRAGVLIHAGIYVAFLAGHAGISIELRMHIEACSVRIQKQDIALILIGVIAACPHGDDRRALCNWRKVGRVGDIPRDTVPNRGGGRPAGEAVTGLWHWGGDIRQEELRPQILPQSSRSIQAAMRTGGKGNRVLGHSVHQGHVVQNTYIVSIRGALVLHIAPGHGVRAGIPEGIAHGFPAVKPGCHLRVQLINLFPVYQEIEVIIDLFAANVPVKEQGCAGLHGHCGGDGRDGVILGGIAGNGIAAPFVEGGKPGVLPIRGELQRAALRVQRFIQGADMPVIPGVLRCKGDILVHCHTHRIGVPSGEGVVLISLHGGNQVCRQDGPLRHAPACHPVELAVSASLEGHGILLAGSRQASDGHLVQKGHIVACIAAYVLSKAPGQGVSTSCREFISLGGPAVICTGGFGRQPGNLGAVHLEPGNVVILFGAHVPAEGQRSAVFHGDRGGNHGFRVPLSSITGGGTQPLVLASGDGPGVVPGAGEVEAATGSVHCFIQTLRGRYHLKLCRKGRII